MPDRLRDACVLEAADAFIACASAWPGLVLKATRSAHLCWGQLPLLWAEASPACTARLALHLLRSGVHSNLTAWGSPCLSVLLVLACHAKLQVAEYWKQQQQLSVQGRGGLRRV